VTREAERLVKQPADLQKLEFLMPDPEADDYHHAAELQEQVGGARLSAEEKLALVLDSKIPPVYTNLRFLMECVR